MSTFIFYSKYLYIDSEDFSLCPPPKYFRLKKDGYVRLKNAYIIKCDDVLLNDDGTIKELLCSYVPESRSGADTSGIKCKGTIHWVSAEDSIDVRLNMFDYLINDGDGDYMDRVNRDSLTVLNGKAEKFLADAKAGERFQFLRQGYFIKRDVEGQEYNSIVGLKDSFKVK